MKIITAYTFSIVFIAVTTLTALLPPGVMAQQLSAREIVSKVDEKLNGERSGYSMMSMTIVRPSWQRTVEFRSWSLGSDYALTLITAPAREKGQTFLKRHNELWSWYPAINRLVRLPPSIMSQGWMGSDYTNDDILRESSVVSDYDHLLEDEEEVDGRQCYRITLTAREEAAILWSRQQWWVEKSNFIVVRALLYDEEGYLVRTERTTDTRIIDGRVMPSTIELVPAEQEGYKTVLKIIDAKFNIDIDEKFFTQQNMKSIR